MSTPLSGYIKVPWTGTSWRGLPTLSLWQAPIPNQASLRPVNFRLAGPSNCNFFHLWALLLLIFTPPPIIPHLSIPDRAKSVHLVVFADGSWPAEPTGSLIKMKDHALSWPPPTVSVCSLLGWGGRWYMSTVRKGGDKKFTNTSGFLVLIGNFKEKKLHNLLLIPDRQTNRQNS